MTTLRLILGDQLNARHSWFAQRDPDVVYVLMEIRQETDYVLHHAQKILAIFAAMRDFAGQLRDIGHNVHYLAIDDPGNAQSLPANLNRLIDFYAASGFHYQAPDEWRLDDQLARYAHSLHIDHAKVDSEHFFEARDAGAIFFGDRPQWRMELFYRHMRARHRILVDDRGRPEGGKWNFDHDNRKAWQGEPREPIDRRKRHDHSVLWTDIVSAGVKSFGDPAANQLPWPVNRTEALSQLGTFIAEALPHFGAFQDAMSRQASRLFHSLLSFALNTKMLSPGEVVEQAQQAWRDRVAPLNAVEGFIRQILGWREYVRAVYWARMPGYERNNAFAHTRELPAWFWTGQTRMRCMAHAIGQSLQHAHAHHIQRLMVIGNFALLAGIDPAPVHRWYLGIYIDAFEWVELPNTLGMSQFADGGLLASKPYVSSAAYIDRMSDYCKGCYYNKSARTGTRACPFNALYWNFFERNAPLLGDNHRLGMVYRTLQKMDDATRSAIREQAALTLRNIETL